MALPLSLPSNFNPEARIPNGPFYSPQTNTLSSAAGPLIVGSGININYATSVISVSGAGGGGSGTVTLVSTGAGLIGGPITTTGTIALANTPVTPNTYTYATFTVDAYGRVTAASSGASPVSSVNTGAGLTGGPITSSGTISLTNTTVTPGTYTFATFTVDANGRLTAASSGATPVSSVIGTAPITVTGTTVRVVSIAAASTTAAGAVQLYNNTDSTSTTLALTAAQGYSLQQQINSLTLASNLTLAGTFNAATGLVLSTTTDGVSAGFTAGAVLPAAAVGNQDYFVIVTTGGTYDPPGPTGPFTLTQGDWLLSSGTQWNFLDVGPTVAYATTTVAGSVCLSTNALAQAGFDNTTALTPATARSAFVPNVCFPSKGALIGGTSVANTPVVLPIGASGQILTADPAAATGFSWKNPATSGTVTSVATGVGLTGGPIVTTGTIALANTAVTAGAYTNANITVDAQGRVTAAANGTSCLGTVTNVITGAGLTGGPITSTGTVSLATTAVTPGAYTNASLTVDAYGRLTAVSTGTAPVTSVATGTGLTGGPITSTGTIALANTAVTPGSYTNSSFTVDAQGRLTAAASGTSPVTSITAGTGLSGGTITSVGTIDLANTAVTAGSYTNASITVDVQGRLTAASSGLAPLTALTGTTPIAVTAGTTPTVSIAASSTTAPGAVQLYNNTDSTSTALALTAAQGKNLQDQITALAVNPSITLAGTVNADTGGTVESVTSAGTIAGYVIGNTLPAASATTVDTYVIVTTPGTMTPPGGVATAATRGDWFLVSETSPGVYAWTFLNVGFDVSYATTASSGVVCLSTNALAQAGVDTLTALTPAAAASAYIPKTCVTAKGTLITGTAANIPTSLPIGTDGQILAACAAATTGLCWIPGIVNATPTVAGIVLGCTTATNSALGCNALLAATGINNVGVGSASLCSNFTGGQNTAIGSESLCLSTGSSNVGVGYRSLSALISGNANTALGSGAGNNITTGFFNVAIGVDARVASPTGSCQLAIGYSATCNWLTGDNGKNIKPGAGIRDCDGNLGSAGQVLTSTGSVIQWGSSTGSCAIGICNQGAYLALDDFEYALWNGVNKSFVIRNKSASTKYASWTSAACNASLNSNVTCGIPEWTFGPGTTKYFVENLGLITFNASQTALIAVYATPTPGAGPALCVYCFTGIIGDGFANNWMCISRLY